MQKTISFYDFINQRLKKEGLPTLSLHQRNVLADPHRFKSITWHRKAGKTLMSIVELLKQSQLRIGTYWIIFPFLDEGRDTVWNGMLFKIIPEEMIEKKNENFMSVKFTNGSYLRLKGADHPDSLRGPNVVGVIFDEFAKQKLEAWKIVSPMITATKGWAWFVSTPIGKNHHYDYYLRGKSGDSPQWKSWYLRASESKLVSQDELEREYDDLGPEMYSQEYECAWLEGAGQVFRGVDKVLTATPQGPLANHLYVIGCDIAKLQDYTVLTVFDRANNMQVFQDRFSRIDWPLQRQRIAEVSRLYNGAIVQLDATGIGDPMVDELARIGIPTNPVKFTEPLKREMVDKLQRWIQNQWLSLLHIKETVEELGDYAYKKGPTGKYQYSAPSGRHDDIVMSLALAVLELSPVSPQQKKQVEPTPLQLYKQGVFSRYNNPDEEYFEQLSEWERL